MKYCLCILFALFAAGCAIISQPLHCINPNLPTLCAPRVPTTCPRKNPISECSTCCCNSSENVEFYDPKRPEPWCTAPPARFTVKFVGTWSRVCHPDYYFSSAHWSPPTGASHNTNYQMWDACMGNVSDGVAQVSQFGRTTIIEREYSAAGDNILDTFKASGILGVGATSRDLIVDSAHQWVSTVTMLAPSQDRMVGVANLRLCEGHDWKRSVKVCSELFSTATRSSRVHDAMQRNTIQSNNCSFGYFEFTFEGYQNATQETPMDCDYDFDNICPPSEHFPTNCRTCCCKSSDSVEFHHPNNGVTESVCGASENAEYKVSLIPSISDICHPDYPFVGGRESSYFSGLSIMSHASYPVFDKCLKNTRSQIYDVISNTENKLMEFRNLLAHELEEGHIYSYHMATNILEKVQKKRRSGRINVSPTNSHVSFFSKLMPSMDQWVGVSSLSLCGPSGWKEKLEVCLPLLAVVNRTESPWHMPSHADAQAQIQGNYCSFARAVIERRPKQNPSVLPPTCKPHNESIFTDPNLSLSACCYCEFILEGQIIRTIERYGDDRYSHTLVARITAVHYDDIGQIEVGDVVHIKVCSLPFRIKFKRTYRLTGARECGSNELEISENGILANIPELESGPLGEGPCVPYILGGNCDD